MSRSPLNLSRRTMMAALGLGAGADRKSVV